MPLAAIALGSNLPSRFGERADNLREAASRIALFGVVRARSTFYDTSPFGYVSQPRFLNAALLLETSLHPLDLMAALLDVELAMGRDRTTAPAKGPRIIDLDLLLFEDLIIDHPGSSDAPALTLPHPGMAERSFVLVPLAEIAPDMVHPTTGLTITQLVSQLTPLS